MQPRSFPDDERVRFVADQAWQKAGGDLERALTLVPDEVDAAFGKITDPIEVDGRGAVIEIVRRRLQQRAT